jgi:FolB domain-containing protein
MKLTKSEKRSFENAVNGTIGFKKLQISCIIGVEEHERVKEQDVFVDLKISYDISPCISNDTFIHAIDYVSLSETCTHLAQEGKFQLIETYAYQVLRCIHEKYPIKHAWILVEKPSAIPLAKCSFVELEMSS